MLCGLFFWCFSASFSFSKNSEISYINFEIHGTCYSTKKTPARNAPLVVLAGSSGNKRRSFPKTEQAPRIPLWKQILVKWTYYKGNMKSKFYCENLDPTDKCLWKSLFNPEPGNEYSSVRSFCTGRIDPNMKEESDFRKKNLISDVDFCPNQRFPGLG